MKFIVKIIIRNVCKGDKMFDKIVKKIVQYKPIKIEPKYVNSSCEFYGKTALIIGGGSGIGLQIAKELRCCGANVLIAGRIKHVVEKCCSVVLDVSDICNLERNLNEIDKYNAIDIVVNAQGICPEIDFKQKFYEVDKDDFEKVMLTNCESVFFVCQHYIKVFEQKRICGNILNICSTEGLKGCIVPYGISKAAVISLTKGLGKAVASKGIVVNGIAPGATATKMMGMKIDDDVRLNYIPSKRATVPVEISKLAHLLLSDAGRQMCGQVVIMDGGESLH